MQRLQLVMFIRTLSHENERRTSLGEAGDLLARLPEIDVHVLVVDRRVHHLIDVEHTLVLAAADHRFDAPLTHPEDPDAH